MVHSSSKKLSDANGFAKVRASMIQICVLDCCCLSLQDTVQVVLDDGIMWIHLVQCRQLASDLNTAENGINTRP